MPDCLTSGNLLIKQLFLRAFLTVMTEISFTSLLTKAMPWLFAVPVMALAAGALTTPEFSRLWLLLPSLLVVTLAALPLVQKHKPDLPLYTLAAALLFITALTANTALNHTELLTPEFRNAVIMLVLPFGLLLAGLLAPRALLQNTKPLLLALLVLEVLLVGQIWYSYITGWGEVYDGRDGIRRAYGAAGDGYTVVLVFITLLNFVRLKALRFAFAFTAMLMCGGKMGLVLLIIGMVLSLPTLQLSHSRIKKLSFTVLLGLILGFGVTSAHVRAIIMPAQLAYITSTTAPTPEVAAYLSTLPQESTNLTSAYLPGTEQEAWTKRSLPVHILYNAIGTGMGRLITLGAACQIFSQYPVSGIGYGQSGNPDIFIPAATADLFGLSVHFGLHPNRLASEKFIGNQTATIAAEQGLIGLVPFVLFCIAAILLSAKVWWQLKTSNQEPSTHHALGTAASIWVFCLIAANQTASWLVPGTSMSIWLGLTLGLCAAAYREKTQHA